MIKPLEYRIKNREIIPGIESEVGILEIKGPTVTPGYLGMQTGSHLSEDGFYDTGDLVWIDKNNCINIIGRKSELTRWHDGTYIDPQYLSNLMVRNIFIKDALVTQRNPQDDFLSVFVYPDKTRILNDAHWQMQLKTGLTENQIFRQCVEDAIDYAQSISTSPAPLSKKHIYVLNRKLKRTPTHKIKFLYELKCLDEAAAVDTAQLNLHQPDPLEDAVIPFDWSKPLPNSLSH